MGSSLTKPPSAVGLGRCPWHPIPQPQESRKELSLTRGSEGQGGLAGAQLNAGLLSQIQHSADFVQENFSKES